MSASGPRQGLGHLSPTECSAPRSLPQNIPRYGVPEGEPDIRHAYIRNKVAVRSIADMRKLTVSYSEPFNKNARMFLLFQNPVKPDCPPGTFRLIPWPGRAIFSFSPSFYCDSRADLGEGCSAKRPKTLTGVWDVLFCT